MASPFGLAYGIGAGLAGVPGAITEGRKQAINMGMQKLALQNAQRQMEEQQALDQALSMPIQQQTETTPEMETMPRAMTPTGEAFQLAGTMRVPTGKMVEQPVSQYEQMAFEMNQRAQRMKQLGFGASAFKLQEQATKYASLAQEEAGQGAARALLAGSQDAPQRLAKLGFNVRNISRMDDKFILEDEAGNPTALDYNDLAALTAGKSNLSTILQKIGSSENQAASRRYAEEARDRRQKEMIAARREEIIARGDIQKQIREMMNASPSAFRDRTPASIKRWEYLIADEMASTGTDYNTARRAVLNREGVEAKTRLTPAQEIKSLLDEIKLGVNPVREKEILGRVEDIRQSQRRGKPVVEANPQRKQFRNKATGQPEWFKMVNGKWVKE